MKPSAEPGSDLPAELEPLVHELTLSAETNPDTDTVQRIRGKIGALWQVHRREGESRPSQATLDAIREDALRGAGSRNSADYQEFVAPVDHDWETREGIVRKKAIAGEDDHDDTQDTVLE